MSVTTHPSRVPDAMTTAAPLPAVDCYGFFVPSLSPSHTEGTMSVTSCGAYASDDVDLGKELTWWRQSLRAYLLLQSADPPFQTAQQQLQVAWWDRIGRHGGLPSPGLRRCVWRFLSGDAQRSDAARAADRRTYAARAAAVASAVAAHHAHRQHQVWLHQTGTSSPAKWSPEGSGTDLAGGPSVPAGVLATILRDLPRTFPGHCLFAAPATPSEGAGASTDDDDEGTGERRCARAAAEGAVDLSSGQWQLLRVLCVYSTLDPEVGYCQGMAFVAGVMLLQAPESEAFSLFRHVMQGRKWHVRALYKPGFPLLGRLLALTEQWVARLLPRLHHHLYREGLTLDAFASQWFLTFFSTQLPMPVLCRLWDAFLVGGWRVWLQVAVGLLRQEAAALMRRDMEDMLLYLQARARARLVGQTTPTSATGSATVHTEESLVKWFLTIPVDQVDV